MISVCEVPIAWGPRKGIPATGTVTGYDRHRRAGEPACGPCRAAQTAYRDEWAKANPEKHAAYQRRWNEANKERLTEYHHRWREANRGRVREADRRSARKNRDKRREADRRRYEADKRKAVARVLRWQKANPEKHAEIERRRRARQRQVLTVSFTEERLAARMAFWGNRCWMCGDPGQEIDHVIPLALGGPHCLSNLRPACRSCNASKGAKRLT